MGWIPESYAIYLRDPKEAVTDFSEKEVEGSIIEAFWDNAGPALREALIRRMLFSHEYAKKQEESQFVVKHGDRTLITLNVVSVERQEPPKGINRRSILKGRLKALHEQYNTVHPIDRESWTPEKRREFNLFTYAADRVYMSNCSEEEAMEQAIEHMDWVDSLGKEKTE